MSLNLNFEIYGDVSEEFASLTEETLSRTYELIDTGDTTEVLVRLVDSIPTLRELCNKEKEELGIDSFGEEGFISLHDCWEAVPRITVCEERFSEVPEDVGIAALEHEAGHSILHNRVDFYKFSIGEEEFRLAKQMGLTLFTLRQIFYLVSIAVKDFEVERLLAFHEFSISQIDLALYQMSLTSEEKNIWEIVKDKPEPQILYLTSYLKQMLFYKPLLLDDEFLLQIADAEEKMLSHLPEEEQQKLSTLVEKICEGMGENTHRNINFALSLALKELGSGLLGVLPKPI